MAGGAAAVERVLVAGTLVVGQAGSGRATLTRQLAARRFWGREDAALVYVGHADEAARLDANLPRWRRWGEFMPSEDSVLAHAAVVVGYTREDGWSRRTAYDSILASLRLAAGREGRSPFIIAADGLNSLVDEFGAGNLWPLLKGALAEPGACELLLAVEQYGIFDRLVGEDVAELLTRFEHTYLLRNACDREADRIVTLAAAPKPREMSNGQAVLIRQRYDESGGLVVQADEPFQIERDF